MGPPYSQEMDGLKKGPWSPEEDILLVSYIQQHGPGNWRAVAEDSGLRRCCKSCRLRWMNYLRPGIKHGNFSPEEENIIISCQALLGNRWSAIASYLPQRTDNDIKNYWHTHLKKKVQLQMMYGHIQVASASRAQVAAADSNSSWSGGPRVRQERMLHTNINLSRQPISSGLAITPTASSTTATATANFAALPRFSSSPQTVTQPLRSSVGGYIESSIMSPAHPLNKSHQLMPSTPGLNNVTNFMFPDGLNTGPSLATPTQFPFLSSYNVEWLDDSIKSSAGHDQESFMITPSPENNQGVTSNEQMPSLKLTEKYWLLNDSSSHQAFTNFGATGGNETEDMLLQDEWNHFGGRWDF